jgi:hypothetical protein
MIDEKAVQELREQTHQVVRAWFAQHASQGDLLRRISFEINVDYAEAIDYVDRVIERPSSPARQLVLNLFGDLGTTHQEGDPHE